MAAFALAPGRSREDVPFGSRDHDSHGLDGIVGARKTEDDRAVKPDRREATQDEGDVVLERIEDRAPEAGEIEALRNALLRLPHRPGPVGAEHPPVLLRRHDVPDSGRKTQRDCTDR
jgi:hypothetical protein